jgi:hypothetical protein
MDDVSCVEPIKILYETIHLVKEINNEILNNSKIYYFDIDVNLQDYRIYLSTYRSYKLDPITYISIKFVINLGYIRTVSIIYTDKNMNKISKNNILNWMTQTIFEELC